MASYQQFPMEKNNLMTPDAFASSASSPFDKVAAKVYKEYQHRLKQGQIMDFDDLIMQTLVLFKKRSCNLTFLSEQISLYFG